MGCGRVVGWMVLIAVLEVRLLLTARTHVRFFGLFLG